MTSGLFQQGFSPFTAFASCHLLLVPCGAAKEGITAVCTPAFRQPRMPFSLLFVHRLSSSSPGSRQCCLFHEAFLMLPRRIHSSFSLVPTALSLGPPLNTQHSALGYSTGRCPWLSSLWARDLVCCNLILLSDLSTGPHRKIMYYYNNINNLMNLTKRSSSVTM